MYKKFYVPSKSQPGQKHEVRLYKKGNAWCSCPATVENCRHVRIVKWHKGYVQGGAERCFYSAYTKELEEHHLLRAAYRQFSISVYLTRWVHQLATDSKEFELHLTNLFLETMEKIQKIKTKGYVKSTGLRNTVDSGKSLSVLLHCYDMTANDFGKIPGDHLVKLKFPEGKMFAMVGGAKKKNYKSDSKENRVEVRIIPMPGEFVNWVKVSNLDLDTEVELVYNREWQD